jgi:hypothetical protein
MHKAKIPAHTPAKANYYEEKALKGTVQRDLRGVKSGINR